MQSCSTAHRCPLPQDDDLEQLKRTASTKHAGACSGSSSEVEEEEESHSGHKQKDKDWAALTTWLRMNLHHVGALCCPELGSHLRSDFPTHHPYRPQPDANPIMYCCLQAVAGILTVMPSIRELCVSPV